MLCRAHDNGQLYADQEDGSRAHGWWHVPRPTTKFHLHLLFEAGLCPISTTTALSLPMPKIKALGIPKFDTEAERNAYLQALRDSNGWMDFCTWTIFDPGTGRVVVVTGRNGKRGRNGNILVDPAGPKDLACVWNQRWETCLWNANRKFTIHTTLNQQTMTPNKMLDTIYDDLISETHSISIIIEIKVGISTEQKD